MWNGNNYFLLAKQSLKGRQYTPLYIHSVAFVQPLRSTKATEKVMQIESLTDAISIADKLRWLRCQHGLLQIEVAQYVGITRKEYNRFERTGARDYYPLKIMLKIAELYDIDVEAILDEYNLFLYRGQVNQIKALREARGMTQSQYANYLGVAPSVVQHWECTNYSRVTKASWALIVEKEYGHLV